MIKHPIKNQLWINSNNQEENNLDLTALVDVIFILLIFFILTFGITQVSTDIQLPTTEYQTENGFNNENPVLIEIVSNIDWKINDQKFKNYVNVKKELLALYKKNNKTSFILIPEKKLAAEHLIRLFNFFSSNNIQNVQVISEWKS